MLVIYIMCFEGFASPLLSLFSTLVSFICNVCFLLLQQSISVERILQQYGETFSLLDLNYTGFYLCSLVFILMLSGRELGIQIKQVTSFYSRAYCVVLNLIWKSDDFEKQKKVYNNCTEEIKCVMEILMMEHVDFSDNIVLFSWDPVCLLCISANKGKTMSLKLVG